MSRRYDSKTTTFTPDGKLMQVEYAIDATTKTGSAIGIVVPDGIILATERMDVSFLLEQSKTSEKIYCIDNHLFCVVSGLTADANILINEARYYCQEHRYYFQTPMPVEQLIIPVCDLKQNNTQFGGLRPYGAAFLFAGYDKIHGYQLYDTDPSGIYRGWNATAIGSNNLAATSYLKSNYNNKMTLDEGLSLGLQALVKTMDTVQPSANKIEMLVITKNKDDEVTGTFLKDTAVEKLLKENKLNEQSDKE